MYTPYSIPISVKGIVIDDGNVWLRKSEHNEWELPGGKLDDGEQPEQTAKRELREELGFEVVVKDLISAHVCKIDDSIDEQNGVLILSYLCELKDKVGEFETEGESGQAEFKAFGREEIASLNMPQFYKDAILSAFK